MRGTSRSFKYSLMFLLVIAPLAWNGWAQKTTASREESATDPVPKSYFPRPFPVESQVEKKQEEKPSEPAPPSIFRTLPPDGYSQEPDRRPLPRGVAEPAKNRGEKDPKIDTLPYFTRSRERTGTSPILSTEDMEVARNAWKYFEHNYLPKTGMVNPVYHYSRGTIWDVGSILAAFVAAEQLGLIGSGEFRQKMDRVLTTLLSIQLYNNELPNREYDWRTGGMRDIHSEPSRRGSGWSALDLGRLLIWLKIIESWYPDYAQTTENIVKRWKFERACQNHELNGVLADGSKEHLRQEGRLGYEQYAASGYALWSKDVSEALALDHIRWIDLNGEKIPVDERCYPYLTSEPFFLARIELGNMDRKFSDVIDATYRVQKKRWQSTGILTAVTEDAVNLLPWFVYNCIYYEGSPWTTVAHNGKPCPDLRNLSTKAAFAWSAIFDDDYSKALRKRVSSLVDPVSGYLGGVYETHPAGINRSRNVNTNAVILESMLYLQRGKKPFIR